MTNSAKYAYYSPGLLDTQVVFGTLEDCVRLGHRRPGDPGDDTVVELVIRARGRGRGGRRRRRW